MSLWVVDSSCSSGRPCYDLGSNDDEAGHARLDLRRGRATGVSKTGEPGGEGAGGRDVKTRAKANERKRSRPISFLTDISWLRSTKHSFACAYKFSVGRRCENRRIKGGGEGRGLMGIETLNTSLLPLPYFFPPVHRFLFGLCYCISRLQWYLPPTFPRLLHSCLEIFMRFEWYRNYEFKGSGVRSFSYCLILQVPWKWQSCLFCFAFQMITFVME